jgi:PAS domain-containing protein
MSTRLISEPTAGFSQIAEQLEIPATAFDSLIEQLPVGVMVVDRDGRNVYANQMARALRVERVQPLQWAITRALLTEDTVREDEIQVAPVGEPRRWLSAYVTPVRLLGRGVNAAFVVVADSTARRQMHAWAPMIESLVNL